MQTKLALNGKEINLTSEKMKVKSNFLDITDEGKITITGDAKFNPYNPQLEDYVFKVISEKYQNKTYVQPDTINMNNGNAAIAVQTGTKKNPEASSCQISLGSGDKYIDLSASNTNVSLTVGDYGDTSSKSYIADFGIRTPSLTQTSLAESKKNFEKLQDNALETIKNIDIYKYNLKSEKDTDKKHIGFVIGDNYNYSKEVTSIDNQGVDNYSFTSLCCKAIQELSQQVEELKKQLKEGK